MAFCDRSRSSLVEYRTVDDVVRRCAVQVVSVTSPPVTSRPPSKELERRILAGERDVVCFRRHRHRQVGHDGVADRAAAGGPL